MALTKVKAGNILLTTPAASSNDVTPATTQYVTTALANLADSAPSTLNTLNELAAALGDDANFSTTVTNSIAAKLPLAGGTMTGTIAGFTSTGIDDNADATAITIDSSENVGIGTTPSTHYTGYEVLDIGDTLSLMSNNTSTNISTLTNNGYLNSDASNWVRKVTDESTMYEQVSGEHRFKSSASGSAGGAITWSEKMRIDASGNVGIGVSNPSVGVPLTAYYNDTSQFHVGGAQSGISNNTYFNGSAWVNRNASAGGAVLQLSVDGTLAYRTANASATPSMTYKLYMDGGGSLGIGNTSAGSMHANANKLVVGTGSGNQGMSVFAGTSTGMYAFARAVGNNTDAYDGGMSYDGSRNLNFMTNAGAPRMTIDGAGDVVIGHTAAVGTTHKGKLQVKSAISVLDGSNTTAATLSLYSSGANSAFLSVDPDQQGNDTHFYFYIDGANKMYLNSAGRLFIDPLETRAGSGALNILGEVGNSYDAIQFRHNASTVVGRVRTTASSTSYITSSDYRIKENIDYTWDATTRLKQLKPARFNFTIDDTNTLVDGFLAHEVSSIVPEAITGTKDEVDDDGQAVLQGIDHSKLVPLLVKTIQELEARITTLEG